MAPRQARPASKIYKVALASIVGSVIEQYDFLITGVIAATIWGGIFFKLPGLAAVAAAISVYGLGIIIRPVGASIFGTKIRWVQRNRRQRVRVRREHELLGDRLGLGIRGLKSAGIGADDLLPPGPTR